MNHHIEFVHRTRTGIITVVTSSGVTDSHTAIAAITAGEHTYTAGPTPQRHVTVRAQDALGGSYLYANWDGTRRNNLHDLASPPTTETLRYPTTLATYAAALTSPFRTWLHHARRQARRTD
jgi:hypothetical protein